MAGSLGAPVAEAVGCPFDPATLAGLPIGMLHCPECGCMVVAGITHPVCDIDFCEFGVVVDYPKPPGEPG